MEGISLVTVDGLLRRVVIRTSAVRYPAFVDSGVYSRSVTAIFSSVDMYGTCVCVWYILHQRLAKQPIDRSRDIGHCHVRNAAGLTYTGQIVAPYCNYRLLLSRQTSVLSLLNLLM